MISKECIISIGGDNIQRNCLADKNTRFDWVDIVGIPQRPSNIANSLFFASHSTGEGGWDNGYDRRTNVQNVIADKKWSAVIDFEPSSNYSHLQVESLPQLAKDIFDHASEICKPTIFGVTGSVGKTTTVALLEHVARSSGIEATRFYSKRLSPLSVMTHFINRVNQNTSVVVMEYSAYLPDHVDELAMLLPPDYAFLTNIYDTHINPGSFTDKIDIFRSKTRIAKQKTTAFVNDSVLSNLHMDQPPNWQTFHLIDPTVNNPRLPPTLRTSEMFTVGFQFSKILGISDEIFEKSFLSFDAKEDRIIQCQTTDGRNLFFHGETSGGARLKSWFETLNCEEPWFFVEEINFADEDPHGFINILEQIFSSQKTLVLDTPHNRSILPVTANFVNKEVFGDTLRDKAKGYTVYHKALATRQPGFNIKKHLNTMWGV